MFQSWRLKLREAEESLRAGRLDDARRILADGELRQYLPGQRLTEKLIQGFVERSLRKAQTGDALGGWSDLESVRPLAGDGDSYLAARERLLGHLASEVEARLVADDAAGSLALLERIERRQISAKPLKLLRDVARRLESARHLARRGKFAEADEQLQSAAGLRSDLSFIEGRRAAYREKLETCRQCVEEMHRAMAKPDWSRAATLADEVLGIAPEHVLAQEAKRRAWAEVKTRCEPSPVQLTAYNRDAEPSQHQPAPIGFARVAPPAAKHVRDEHPALAQRANFFGPRLFDPAADVKNGLLFGELQLGELQLGAGARGECADAVAPVKRPHASGEGDLARIDSTAAESRDESKPSNPLAIDPRMLLWVDGVGGYLVCLASDVLIGQAVPATPVEVPILGDLSRRHAWIRRQGERYLIEPCRVAGDGSVREAYAPVRINNQLVAKPTLLYDGDEIELGSGVKLRFVHPHALSATARLDFVSRHRPQLRVDGVLLMAESCVLGPNFRNHVVCRDWKDDVVLYRHADRLYCRAMDEIEIDGRLCEGRGELTVQSVVKGDDFSLALEAVRML